MSMKLFALMTLAVWVLTATSSEGQSNYVMDTNNEPLDSDDEYYIRPAITDNGGRFTLVNPNGTCPLHVGLENTDTPPGYAVRFTPFASNDDDDDIRLNSDLRVTFVDVLSTCAQSAEWRVGENDTASGRRLVVTGRDNRTASYSNYFRITQNGSIYNIEWCPTEVCPTCRFNCGIGGILRQNGTIFFALDGSPLPVQFQKKDD
ncbi:hypothetical protein Fmac_020282 [Flemingia macrophylla]|uniref:Uncharacterized protein n=1 Tax=Flemingia macrophylla TaxID=520843 RepID=A0ABD1LVF9_9FABA